MSTSRAILGLSLLGFADALYMLAYHAGWIDRMWCPFFGEGYLAAAPRERAVRALGRGA